MKRLYFFCTKIWYYITELPIILLLVIAALYNDKSSELFKLYPLIVFLSLTIVFIFIYLFRALRISYEDIKSIGLFSSRERVILKKGRTLKITMLKRHNLKIEVFGKNEAPALDWVDPEEYIDKEFNLFRERMLGGEGSVKKILKYFGFPEDCFEQALSYENFSFDTDKITLIAAEEYEMRTISLRFKETV